MKPAGAPPKGPYPCGTNPPRPSRSVDWSEEANASAWAQEIGKAVDTDLMTSAMHFRQPQDLARRGRTFPKAKRPSPAGVLLTATPIALAADGGGGASSHKHK
jgi:hypothetical protein